MATTISGNFSAQVNVTEDATLNGGITQKGVINFTHNKTIVAGTTTGKYDCAYFVQSTIAGSGTLDTTLSSLTDLFGSSIVFAKLNYMYFNLLSTAAGGSAATSITIGAAASHPLAQWISTASDGTVTVKNNGVFFLGSPGTTGYAVASGSADVVTITNVDSGVSAVVNSAYLGKSA